VCSEVVQNAADVDDKASITHHCTVAAADMSVENERQQVNSAARSDNGTSAVLQCDMSTTDMEPAMPADTKHGQNCTTDITACYENVVISPLLMGR